MIAAESAIIRWNFGAKSIRASGITSETRSAISAPANMRCAAKSVWRGAGSVGCSAGSGVICAGSAGERAWAIRIKLSTKKAEAVWNRSFKLTGAGKE